MPTAALSPCRTCGQVGCTAHRRPAWGHAHPVKRITGPPLQRLRRQLFAEHPFCALCHERVAEIRDHIIPLAEGGADNYVNSQAVCRECHQIKTQQEAQRGRARAC